MIKDLNDYLKKSKLSIWISIAFLFASYGLMLISSSFSIDSECYINDPIYEFNWWKNLGRWGLTFINKLFNLKNLVLYFNDYLTVIMLILFIIAFGYLIYLYMPKEYEKAYLKTQFILPIIFLSSPIFAEQFSFSMQNVAVSLGMLLIAVLFIAYYYAKNLDKKYKYFIYLVGMIITSIVFGIYQSLIALYVAVVIILYFLKCLNEKDNCFKFLITELIRFLLSFIIYFVICKLTSNGNNYLQTGYSAGIIVVLKNIYNIIVSMIKNETIFYNISYSIALIILLFLFIKISKDKKMNLGIVLSFIGLVLMPYFIMIITGVDQYKRTQFNYPLFIGFIILFGTLVLLTNNKKIVKSIGYVCLVFALGIAYKQTLITATLFQTHEQIYNEDIRNVQKIESIIENKDWYDENTYYKLILVGKLEPKSKTEYLKGEIIGQSFFEFEYDKHYGVNSRGVIFMNNLGNNYQLSDKKEFEFAKEYVQKNQLAIFPNKDSAQLIDNDTIIIRLSEEM